MVAGLSATQAATLPVVALARTVVRVSQGTYRETSKVRGPNLLGPSLVARLLYSTSTLLNNVNHARYSSRVGPRIPISRLAPRLRPLFLIRGRVGAVTRLR